MVNYNPCLSITWENSECGCEDPHTVTGTYLYTGVKPHANSFLHNNEHTGASDSILIFNNFSAQVHDTDAVDMLSYAGTVVSYYVDMIVNSGIVS